MILDSEPHFEVAHSAISLASMPYASDFYGGLVPVIEEDTVVTAAETEAGFWRFEFFTSPVRLER